MCENPLPVVPVVTTDKAKCEALLQELQIMFQNDNANEGQQIIIGDEGFRDARVSGYAGFVTVFEFDAAGTFVSVGAWE